MAFSGSSAPKMAVPATMTLLPWRKITGMSDLARPGFPHSSTYRRQRISRSFWVQHRRRLRYLYLGTAYAVQIPWARICPRISGHPCLRRPLSGNEYNPNANRLTWVDGHHEKHVGQVSDLVGNGGRRCVGRNRHTRFHFLFMYGLDEGNCVR